MPKAQTPSHINCFVPACIVRVRGGRSPLSGQVTGSLLFAALDASCMNCALAEKGVTRREGVACGE